MNTHLLHKLEKYRNKIKYENKSEDIYLSKLDKYLHKYLYKLSGGLPNFERVKPISLINSKGISILLGSYFPANLNIGGKSVTKTVFEYVIVPYGSTIERYTYYYLDNYVDRSNRKHVYLKSIQTWKPLPRVKAQLESKKLKLYIYAYNQELATGMKDIKDMFTDQLNTLRQDYDKFTPAEKNRMDRDAKDSRTTRHMSSYGDYGNYGDIGDYGDIGYDGDEPESDTSFLSHPISATKEQYLKFREMFEDLLKGSASKK
jgi:hypothetical protein